MIGHEVLRRWAGVPLLTLLVVKRSLEGPERRLITASNGLEAVEALRDHAVDLLVTDLEMPLMGGFQLLAHVASRYPSVPVLLLRGVLDHLRTGVPRGRLSDQGGDGELGHRVPPCDGVSPDPTGE